MTADAVKEYVIDYTDLSTAPNFNHSFTLKEHFDVGETTDSHAHVRVAGRCPLLLWNGELQPKQSPLPNIAIRRAAARRRQGE